MSSLTPYGRGTEQQLALALARQLGNMELATQIAQAGLHEIALVHRDATDVVRRTLTTAKHMVKAATYAGRITPAKESELRHQTQAYLQEMLGITHDTSAQIIDILAR
jgi:hypothetical protein